jgi:tetratricopeptide (TPR) repeat protein
MRSVVLACILTVVTATNAGAAWAYAASEHFEVYAAGGDRDARDALNYFERVHAFFTDYMGLPTRPGTVTRLVVFNGDRQFAPYRLNEVSTAFYLSGPDRDFIVMKSFDENANRIVVHEYAHLVIRHAGLRFPLWLNEGLAEFFSTLAPEGQRMSVGAVPLDRLLYLSDRTTMLPLERLFAVTSGSSEYNTQTHAGVFYSQSWALTHMLMVDSRYRGKFKDLQKRIGSGMPSAAAFAEVYGMTPAAVARDLANYVQRNQYSYFLANYKFPPLMDKVATRAVDAFEADLMGANLLAGMINRQDEARAAFARLSSQRPDDLALAESRAYFELRRGRRDQALPQFARAVQLGSRNPRLYRDFAAIEPSRAEELLGRALLLAPDDLDIRVRYGRVLLNQRKSADAIATLMAVKGDPQDFNLFQVLATAYMQTNQLPEAREAAGRAAKYAEPGPEAEFAARLVKSIDDALAFRARAQQPAARSGAPPATSAPPGVAATAAPFRGPLLLVDGRITNKICGSGPPVLEVTTGKETVRLLIDDPIAVTVVGKGASATALECGRLNIPISVGFEPTANAEHKTEGNVRRLDYRGDK